MKVVFGAVTLRVTVEICEAGTYAVVHCWPVPLQTVAGAPASQAILTRFVEEGRSYANVVTFDGVDDPFTHKRRWSMYVVPALLTDGTLTYETMVWKLPVRWLMTDSMPNTCVPVPEPHCGDDVASVVT